MVFNFIRSYETGKLKEKESIENSVQDVYNQLVLESESIENEVIQESIEKYNSNQEKLNNMPNLLAKQDILNLAKTYSLFTSGDLPGEHNGVKQLLPYLEEGTQIYDMVVYFAYEYKDNVKIQHELANPPFSNEYIGDYEAIGDNEFAIEVSLEKKMIDPRKEFIDKFHEKMVFKYFDNGKIWKWVSNLKE